MMGASCSVICDSDKVVKINIPRIENQQCELTEYQCQEKIIQQSNLRMNFAPNLPVSTENAVSEATIESNCSEIEDTVLQHVIVKQTEEPPRNTADKPVMARLEPPKQRIVKTPPNHSFWANSNAKQQTQAGPSNSSGLEITRKVGEILDEVISPEPTGNDNTKVGRQSRLMHADMNTVVSVDHGRKVKKTKKTKVKATLITVKPYEDTEKPESPPGKLHVCKHGIPIVDDLDDEEGGCTKCQRPNSRGGRELQEYLNTKKSERKRKFWAKDTEKKGRTSRKSSVDVVEKALKEFEEFHEKHEPPT